MSSVERLEKVARKQEEWKGLPAERKLEFLLGIHACMKKIQLDGWIANSRCVTQQLFQLSLTSPLGEFIVSEETLITINTVTSAVAALEEAYRIRVGEPNPALTELQFRRAVNGQIVAKVFPLRPMESNGLYGQCTGEVWFDPTKVTDEDQIHPFDFGKMEHPTAGALLVLGAGNHDFLTIFDILQGLFVTNQVVYVKLHPLRNHLETLLRQIFAPLIRQCYFDCELHESAERSAELVYSKWVGAVHMTGGKTAHDAIVWGASREERQDRISRQDPKLKARMTSELGCVTPWIIAAAEYTPEELAHQATSIPWAIRFRGSANCISPNTVVMAKSWKQRGEFVDIMLQVWKDHDSSLVYYPGSKARWEAFQQAYPHARVVQSMPNEDLETETNLRKTSLPLLVVEIDVDITTPEGIQKAKDEYAFSHEAFAPVLVLAVIDDTLDGSLPFLELATKLSNELLFGTLTCHLTVPPSMARSDELERAIASLNYGTVALNMFAILHAISPSLVCGAAPGELLEDVQSGIGKGMNFLFLPHVVKCVVRTPIICAGHFVPTGLPYQDDAAQNLGISKFLLNPLRSSVEIKE